MYLCRSGCGGGGSSQANASWCDSASSKRLPAYVPLDVMGEEVMHVITYQEADGEEGEDVDVGAGERQSVSLGERFVDVNMRIPKKS